LAVGAHPADIEFLMAGALRQLRRAGWEIHCMNVADGCLGSRTRGVRLLRLTWPATPVGT